MCCLRLPFSGFLFCFFLFFFFFLCLPPTYPQTLDLFLSLITSTRTTKKEQNHVNDQLYFWKKPTVMYSQLAYRVSCSAKRQQPSGNLSCCLFTFHLQYETYLQNHPMATVYLQIQLHHQSWKPGDNQWAPDVKAQVLSTYAEVEFLLALGWTQAMLIRWLTMDSTAYQN